MYIVVQFPISDIRKFTKHSDNVIPQPNWPSPRPGKQFIRNFGLIKQRPKGGLNSWIGENYICDAKRALRLFFLPRGIEVGYYYLQIVNTYRRFYFDGLATGKFEIALKIIGDWGLNLSKNDTTDLINRIFNQNVKIVGKTYTAECRLINAGKHLAESYLRATSKKINENDIDNQGLVSSGKTVVFIELQKNEDIALPYFHKPIELKDVNNYSLNHYLMPGNTDLWELKHEESFGDVESEIRGLRLYLLRLNAEIESFKNVLNALVAEKLNIDEKPQSGLFIKYLESKSKIILKKIDQYELRYGQEMTDLVLQITDVVSPGERQALKENLDILKIQYNLTDELNEMIDRILEKVEGGTVNFNIGEYVAKKDDRSVRINGISNFSGILNIITGNNNNIKQSQVSDEAKAKLNELNDLVLKLSKKMNEDDGHEIARDLQSFTEEAICKKPRKEFLEFMADKLKKAAAFSKEYALPIASVVKEILALVL